MNLENLGEILQDENIAKQLSALKNDKVKAKFPCALMICNLLLEFVKPEMLEVQNGYKCAERVVPLGIEKVVVKTKVFDDNCFIFGRSDFVLNKKFPRLSLSMSRFNNTCYMTANEIVNNNLIESYYLFDYDDNGKLKSIENCTNGEMQEIIMQNYEAE